MAASTDWDILLPCSICLSMHSSNHCCSSEPVCLFIKEEILLGAYNSNKIVYGVALFTSGLTAFYMFRLYFSIFWNKKANVYDHSAPGHRHGEGPFSMKLPLIIL